MSKGILEFSLPEESEEFELAQAAVKFSCAIHDIQEAVRRKIKYSEMSAVEAKAWEEIKQEIYDVCATYNIP